MKPIMQIWPYGDWAAYCNDKVGVECADGDEICGEDGSL